MHIVYIHHAFNHIINVRGDSMNKIDKFNKFEKIFLKIHLILLGLGVALLGMSFAFVDTIEELARSIWGIVYALLYVVFFLFAISVVRLIKYLIYFRKSEVIPSIKRTLIIILTSPISLGLYVILVFIMSLSMASCEIT